MCARQSTVVPAVARGYCQRPAGAHVCSVGACGGRDGRSYGVRRQKERTRLATPLWLPAEPMAANLRSAPPVCRARHRQAPSQSGVAPAVAGLPPHSTWPRRRSPGRERAAAGPPHGGDMHPTGCSGGTARGPAPSQRSASGSTARGPTGTTGERSTPAHCRPGRAGPSVLRDSRPGNEPRMAWRGRWPQPERLNVQHSTSNAQRSSKAPGAETRRENKILTDSSAESTDIGEDKASRHCRSGTPQTHAPFVVASQGPRPVAGGQDAIWICSCPPRRGRLASTRQTHDPVAVVRRVGARALLGPWTGRGSRPPPGQPGRQPWHALAWITHERCRVARNPLGPQRVAARVSAPPRMRGRSRLALSKRP
jgi:hypothetical protein